MALIKKLEKIPKNIRKIHPLTECSYSIYTDEKGDKYLQLDTNGSAERQSERKTSQTMQFNKEALIQLAEILKNEFGIDV